MEGADKSRPLSRANGDFCFTVLLAGAQVPDPEPVGNGEPS